MNNEWYTDTDEVSNFGGALVDAGFSAKQLQWYYEKPWKWTKEREAFIRGGQEALDEILDGVACD